MVSGGDRFSIAKRAVHQRALEWHMPARGYREPSKGIFTSRSHRLQDLKGLPLALSLPLGFGTNTNFITLGGLDEVEEMKCLAQGLAATASSSLSSGRDKSQTWVPRVRGLAHKWKFLSCLLPTPPAGVLSLAWGGSTVVGSFQLVYVPWGSGQTPQRYRWGTTRVCEGVGLCGHLSPLFS